MKTTLMKEGFRVITGNSGQAALNQIRQEKPDLILLELELPDMNGFEFMRHQACDHACDAEPPIIMMAAAAGIDDRVRCLEMGADDCITKPFGQRELTLRVRAVLRRAGRTAPRSSETAHGLDRRFALA
jgi:DNA-binding response OmpR family regulator